MSTTALTTRLYVPARRSGTFLFLSGQLPFENGVLPSTGRVGHDELTLVGAQHAARVAAHNCLDVIEREIGSLDQVDFVVKLNGYVASAPGFTEQAAVIDAASELLLDVLGARGEHARLAIGVASLPFGAPVELELTVAVKSE